MRRRRIDGTPVLADDVGILLGLQLHPGGHVVVAAVLPSPEPGQDEPHFVFTGLLQQQVDHRKVILALFRLHLLPVERYLQRVGMHFFYHPPHTRQHLGPGGRVVRLPGQNHIRLSVHQQSMASVFRYQLGNGVFFLLRPQDASGHQSRQNQYADRALS